MKLSLSGDVSRCAALLCPFLPSLLGTLTPFSSSSLDRRNSLGGDVLFVGKHHPLCDFIVEQYKTKNTEVGCACAEGIVEVVRVGGLQKCFS